MTRSFTTEAHARSYNAAKKALCASAKGPELAAHLAKIAPLYFFTPYDPSELTEILMKAVEEKSGYPISA